MTKEQKLLELLQPKDYKSKIKLYCRNCKFEVKKFGSLENKSYYRKIIEIKEI